MLLVAKAMGCSAVLSGTSLYEQFMPSLTCTIPAHRPKPDESVSKYSGSLFVKAHTAIDLHMFCSISNLLSLM